jgi:hypothetical protein
MKLRAERRVCHYCESVQKVDRRTGAFKPHEIRTGVVTYHVPSREIEPSLRDPGPTTRIDSPVWRLCMGSERKPWPVR